MIELRQLVKSDERIMWEGRPDKSVTILESIFNPMLVFALIWAGVDLAVVGGLVFSGALEAAGILPFILLFLLIHLMPVWIYLAGVLGSFLRWKNTRFMITDRGLYVSGGVLSFHYEMKPWTDISHVSIHQGVFDRMFGVGDVVSTCSHVSGGHQHGGNGQGLKIYNIPDFMQVFQIVNDLQRDIYADTMYPNDLRPGTNNGYQTRYQGRQ